MWVRSTLILLLSLSLHSCASLPMNRVGQPPEGESIQEQKVFEESNAAFELFKKDVKLALHRIHLFTSVEGLPKFDPKVVKEVIYFENKTLFDQDLLRRAKGKMKTVPKTFVAGGDERVLRAISFEAYLKVFPKNTREDYRQLLIHELAHIYHSELVGDENMGPVWFYEGLPVVLAGQYASAADLNAKQIKQVIHSKKRGSYAKYGVVLRKLMKRVPLKELIEKAKLPEKEFIQFLEPHLAH